MDRGVGFAGVGVDILVLRDGVAAGESIALRFREFLAGVACLSQYACTSEVACAL